MQLIAIAALLVASNLPLTPDAEIVAKPVPTHTDPATEPRVILAGQSHRLEIQARHLESVKVTAARARGLRICLFDGEGKLVAEDDDPSDGLGFAVREGKEGPFTLVIRNESREDNMYTVQVD